MVHTFWIWFKLLWHMGAFLTETLDSDGFNGARGMKFLTKAFGLITVEKESSPESKPLIRLEILADLTESMWFSL